VLVKPSRAASCLGSATLSRMRREPGIAPILLFIGAAASCGDAVATANAPEAPDASVSDAGGTPDAGRVDVIEPDDGGRRDAGPVRAPFGLDARPSNATCLAWARPGPLPPVTFEPVFTAISPFAAPMMMAQLPGDPPHWLLAQRNGKIVRFAAANPEPPVVVADLPALSGHPLGYGNEGGLLGLAPHPKFAENGRVYVSWTTADPAPGGYVRSRIGYVVSSDGGATFTSYTNVLWFDQNNSTHYGGGIAFGRDGYLYVSFGDGTEQWRGQDTTTFFSKILRIDVDDVPPGATYGIPADNPFRLGGGEPATFAWGFRNPFRLSFDRETGDLWVGDVGAARFEEVDRVERGGNYGWPCREGKNDHSLTPIDCPNGVGNTIDPVVDHEHVLGSSSSRSITGGVVYRGKAIPGLVGAYVYGDYVTKEIFVLRYDPATGAPVSTTISAPADNWVSFAEDLDGEVYAVALTGSIYKMVPAGAPPPSSVPARLSETGCVLATDPRQPAPGLVPYGINAPSWDDGAEKTRHLAVPDGKAITVGADGHLELPEGSVVVQTLSLGGKRIETRLLVRHDDGEWAGYSYRWLEDESDAVRLPASSRRRVGAVDWYFPSPGECLRCHTDRAGRVLGLELGQLDGDYVYASTNRIADQLATLEHIGLFTNPLPARPPPLPSPSGAGPLEGRARAYLHANCSSCHRPPGEGRATIDLRFSTELAAAMVCDVAPSAGDRGVAGAKILAPGNPSRSLVSLRLHTTGAGHMPPFGAPVVDEDGVALIDEWIRGLVACPP